MTQEQLEQEVLCEAFKAKEVAYTFIENIDFIKEVCGCDFEDASIDTTMTIGNIMEHIYYYQKDLDGGVN